MTGTVDCDLLIVGGGAAAHSVVDAYRTRRRTGRITLVSAEEHLPYMRPALSKEFLTGAATHDDIRLAGEDFYDGVDLRLGVPVEALDPAARLAVTADGGLLHFGTCVLATGSVARRPPIPGADDPRVHALRSLDSATRLRDAAAGARTAVVLGSGFIGCEAAASLARRGLAVTLVTDEELPHQARLGPDVGERVASWLRGYGVTVVTGASVTGIEDARRVTVAGRAPITGDLVLVGTGAKPVSEIAARAGLAVDRDRVLVDPSLATSGAGIWAAGDIAFADNPTAGRRLMVEHWGEAAAMGAVAGAGAAGERAAWDRVPGFWTQIGDHALKYAAWGDGHDSERFVDHGGGRFTVWYGRGGVLVGALTHDADIDYDRARTLIADHMPMAALAD